MIVIHSLEGVPFDQLPPELIQDVRGKLRRDLALALVERDPTLLTVENEGLKDEGPATGEDPSTVLFEPSGLTAPPDAVEGSPLDEISGCHE